MNAMLGNIKEEELSEEFIRVLERAEVHDWEIFLCRERIGDRTSCCAELKKGSPAGEQFSIDICFNMENQMDSFLENLKEFVGGFDVDEHAERWIRERGRNGVPSSIRTIIEDAEAIGEMCEDLYGSLDDERDRYYLDMQEKEEQEI